MICIGKALSGTVGTKLSPVNNDRSQAARSFGVRHSASINSHEIGDYAF